MQCTMETGKFMVYYVHEVAVVVGSVQATPPLQLDNVRLACAADVGQGALHMCASLCCWENADYATSLLLLRILTYAVESELA